MLCTFLHSKINHISVITYYIRTSFICTFTSPTNIYNGHSTNSISISQQHWIIFVYSSNIFLTNTTLTLIPLKRSLVPFFITAMTKTTQYYTAWSIIVPPHNNGTPQLSYHHINHSSIERAQTNNGTKALVCLHTHMD